MQVLRYISIFCSWKLGTPAVAEKPDTPFPATFHVRATAFLQQRPEMTSEFRLGVMFKSKIALLLQIGGYFIEISA